MTLVTLDGIAKRHAEEQILDGVNLSVDEGDRVGVIGHNGSGKSTLLRILAGVDQPDAGRVVTAAMATIAFVPQEPVLPPALPVREALRDGAVLRVPAGAVAEPAERERRAVALLDRLGISDLDLPVGELSGGQRKRVALAAGLAAQADLLVLDEPTNHLDLDAVDELERRLRARTGGLVIVTHDRYLLDRLATRIVEVEGGALHSGYGTYVDYLSTRQQRATQEAAVDRRRSNRARVELAWLRRGAKARTTKARFRVEQAEALIETVTDGGQPDQGLDLALPAPRLGSKVVEAVDVGVRLGGRQVLRDVTLRLGRGARVGVVGPNGAGKTTLLRVLAGRLAPASGRVAQGETVRTGWYGQEPQALPPDQRVLDAVDEIVRATRLADGRVVSAGELLERFGFPPGTQRAWVGQLSGGERRRLELLRVLGALPNLLFLDEPTNDLDLDTLGVLEEMLDGWQGALVVATHDRYFLDRVCDDVYGVEPGGALRHYPGGWHEWLAHRAQPERAATAPAREHRAAPQRPRRLGNSERRELSRIERQVADLETRKTQLTAALSDGAGDHVAARAAGEQLAGVLAELEVAESRWLELSEVDG